MGQFDVEQAALGVEHLEVAGVAFVVAHARQPGIIVQGFELAAQRIQALSGFAAVEECIVDFAEGVLNGLLVAEDRLLLQRPRRPSLRRRCGRR